MRRVFTISVSVLLALAVLTVTGLWYAGERGVAPGVVAVLLPAFLLELALYAAGGTEAVRARLEEIRPAALVCLLTLSSPLSYLACSAPTGTFDIRSLLTIVGLAAVAALWFLAVPRGAYADVTFLLIMAAPVVLEVFEAVYPDLSPRVPEHSLGLLMWYRTGLVALLVVRRIEGVGFGFVPRRSEWAIGIRNFGFFLPPGIAFAFALGFVRLRPVEWDLRTVLIAAATFFGTLWVLAVAEEFFFRGLLQQLLSRVFRSNVAGLLVASLLFGAAHLGFREFPNWRFAILATVAGLFYGRAFLQARSIRAAMVTHALVVTTWRVFLM